jgi:mannose/fructose/N-acetylgalactosamine-specific phosphotransferase system component IIC
MKRFVIGFILTAAAVLAEDYYHHPHYPPAVTPEPATIALMGAGLVGVALAVKKGRKVK